MKTAVEWLEDNLISEPYSEEDFKHNEKCWDRAKEMNKEQIENAYKYGVTDEYVIGASYYYNETFNQQQ